MFKIIDKTIYCTRGDRVTINVKLKDDNIFNIGDRLKFSIVERKDYNKVYFQKEFVILEEKNNFYMTLSEDDTRFYDVISKQKEFWYEIEYNGNNTVIGYEEYTDEEGEPAYRPKEFILLPEAPQKEEDE